MQEIDPKTLTLAQKGNSEAFTQLVEIYQRPVFNLCYRMLGNPTDAEDAAQETFLRAYKSIKHFDNRHPFPTWLLSIAAHFCIDQIRKRRMNIVSMEDMAGMEISDSVPGPEATLSRVEEQRRIRALLDNLDPVDRAAVVMYYWYDLSYEEISAALSLTISAVKSRLHRARSAMAQRWIDQPALAQSVERTRHAERSPVF